MLGRLNMGVQECIDAYCELAWEVFQEKHSHLPFSKWIGPALGKARFDFEKLEEAVKRMIRTKLGNDQVPMRDDRENACKVYDVLHHCKSPLIEIFRFVCATRTANTELALLRSYRDPEEEGPNCTIWQAARATTAAPAFFSSISFGKPLAEYVDGGLLNNNPIRLLMREATRVWGQDVDFSCVLSIGTGAPPGKKLGSLGHQVLIACKEIATQTETTAREFKAEHNHNLVQKKRYFRFNVAQGLHSIQLEEWQVMDRIDAATKTYLQDVAAEIKDCSGAIKGPSNPVVSPSSRHASGQDFSCPESPQINPLGRSRGSTLSSIFSSSPINHQRSNSNPKPLYWDLPGTASPYFTDRDDLLAGLHDYFNSPQRKDPQVAVLNGLGGMGKTQIALEYIGRHQSEYMGVFFIDGTSEQGLQSAFARIAHLVIEEEMRQSPGRTYDDIEKTLGFSGLVNSPSRRPLVENWERIVGAVQRWFGRLQKSFLVVFDGVDDPSDVHINNFIPYNTTADVILTTTDSTARAYGHLFKVKEMPEGPALDLLSRASHDPLDSEESRSEGLKIVQALGGLPLAINQAGGYLATSEPDISEFLPTYEAHARDLLSKMPLDGMNRYRKSAFTTWELSYEKLLSTAPISAKLLELLSFVYPKDICPPLYHPSEDTRSVKPRRGLKMRRNSITKNVNVEAGFSDLNKDWVTKFDPYLFKGAFASLLKFCLVNRTTEHHAYTVHPVVHRWARERLSTEDRTTYARDAVLLVARALPSLHRENHAEAWKIHRRLLPHVQACWENFCKYVTHSEDQDDECLLQALSILAISKKAQGLNREAAEIFRRVLRGRERVLGPEHQDTLFTLDYLASFYDQQGNLSEAEGYYKRVLDGCERTLGKNHPNTLTVVHDLAGVYEYRGKIREAEKLYQRALEGREAQLGPEDPEVLTTLDALGGLYDHEGRIGEAEELRQRAFTGREKVLGPDHPDTITTALNLGAMYSEQGKLKLAEEM
jgi:tetratricopeptide (TPR) repeat protein/predicted acylesterase/phospholipase RssA